MSSEEQALIDAILAAPDDDGPRLVYADWLSARGDPRGEFITLQCRLAASSDDEARRKLRIAENKLLKAHAAEWGRALEAVAPSTRFGKPAKLEFHRGLIEEVDLPVEGLDQLDAVFAAAPFLRRLRIDAPIFSMEPRPPPSLAGRLGSPHLERVISLDLRIAAAGDAAAVELAGAARLKNLRVLALQASAWPVPGLVPLFTAANLLTGVGATALASSPHLEGLRELHLGLNSLGPEGAKAIVEAPWALRVLDLSGNQLDDVALKSIAASSRLSKLTTLKLGGGAFGAPGLEALARAAKTLPALEALSFDGTQFGPRGLAAFLDALALPKLTRLGLTNTALGDAGAEVLARSKRVSQLTDLEVGDNKLTQVGAFALADSPHVTALERLVINDAWLWKKAVVEKLVASPTLAQCRIYVKGSLLGRSEKPEKAAAPAKKAAAKKAPAKKKAARK